MKRGEGPVGDYPEAAAAQVEPGQLTEPEKGGVLQLAQGIEGEAEVAQLSGEPQRRRGNGGQEVVAEVQADEVVEAAEADPRDGGNVGGGEDKLLEVDQPVCFRPPDKEDGKTLKKGLANKIAWEEMLVCDMLFMPFKNLFVDEIGLEL